VSLLNTASKVLNELEARGVSGCLVGGLAVSVYCDPRFTLDIDLAVAIPGDAQIEAVVHDLSALGFVPSSIVEQESVGRLAIARLIDPDGVSVDLLVASSGIESEVVAAAQPVEVVRGLSMKVAQIGHLIALKLLSRSTNRATDSADLRKLVKVATESEWARAAVAVELIMERGYARGRDLLTDLHQLRSAEN